MSAEEKGLSAALVIVCFTEVLHIFLHNMLPLLVDFVARLL